MWSKKIKFHYYNVLSFLEKKKKVELYYKNSSVTITTEVAQKLENY